MEVAKKLSPIKEKLEGTPMKMLIAQEMSRELESKQKPPGIVAKLMGLDALPAQRCLYSSRSLQERYSCSNSGRNRSREDGYFTDTCLLEDGFKDVYEVCDQPSKISGGNDQSPRKSRPTERQDGNRIALVRQKFIEAKRLAMDEKLLKSNEFQDALEVLSSNRDIFLKFLEEPNSMFCEQLNELRIVAPKSRTKQITVLRPSKMADMKNEKQVKRQTHDGRFGDLRKPHKRSIYTNMRSETLLKPTRIVVLKPDPAVRNSTLRKNLDGTAFCIGLETNEVIGSRKSSKDISRQMRENLSSNLKDESLLSSIFSNCHTGDDTSFNMSENEYVEEDAGIISDSELMSATSHNSWEFISNRFGSPCSFSSISRVSYSPESSVIKEAKKRLSERWALVASNDINLEQSQVRNWPSTLGEMLLIPAVKKREKTDRAFPVPSMNRTCVGEIPRASGVSISREISPRNVVSSRTVTLSSISGNIDSSVTIHANSKDVTTTKTERLSMKGKISSLFFSRNKKTSSDKSSASTCAKTIGGSEVQGNESLLKTLKVCNLEESSVVKLGEKPRNSSSNSLDDRLKPLSMTTRNACLREAPSIERPFIWENSNDYHNHPFPNSVLETPFEDDTRSHMHQRNTNYVNPQFLSRSSPIASLARTLPCADSHTEVSLAKAAVLSQLFSKTDGKEIELQRLTLVEKLLSLSELGNENACTFFSKWHSLDRPLNPMLLDKLLEQKEEGAKCRERSDQRLLFDFVNAALLDIGHAAIVNIYPWARLDGLRKETSFTALVPDEVKRMVRECFSKEEGHEGSEEYTTVVRRVVRRDAGERHWAESIWSEIDDIGEEVGGKVLEELVVEALEGFACWT